MAGSNTRENVTTECGASLGLLQNKGDFEDHAVLNDMTLAIADDLLAIDPGSADILQGFTGPLDTLARSIFE